MKKKQFKTESKKLLDMMINSIYTHKEIFLRELISNASDAIDKLYFRSLTDSSVTLTKGDYAIWLEADKAARTLTISDNGCGMTQEELENNLGTIAKSGSFEFKRDNESAEDVDVIGQFGVGFYSAFMVADKITVYSKPFGTECAYKWESEGADGYTIDVCDKESFGTKIVLYIKPDTEDENYSEFLEEYRLRALVKKYSDYIRYPIKMEITREEPKEEGSSEYITKTHTETLNSMVPIWKRAKGEVSDDEYNAFYSEKYYDYEAPARVITQKSEGLTSFEALLFIPKHAPYNYYTKDYEKGLELYSSGVMITERCKDLLPDYFGFVKGLVDTQDLSLNISREMLQHDRQLRAIAKAIEKKIKSELELMRDGDREAYEAFFDAFGIQLKFGAYSDFGMHKDTLCDLLMFKTSKEGKYATLKEYTERVPEGQKVIYYASGESAEKIAMLPQVDAALSRGLEVLYLTDDVDEFTLRAIGKYGDFEFKNVTAEQVDLADGEAKAKAEEMTKANEEMLGFIKDIIGKVASVKFSANLTKYPVCLSSEGELSVEMEKVLRKMPNQDGAPSASVVMEINHSHPIAERLISLYFSDKDKLSEYAKVLYSIASLINGVSVENPAEFAELVAKLLV
ncbi:MAG: molecular chaperone HtpG [Clostridia bacterium]|nr:molecular chaperone HtpG [Clostridia bacterium]